STPPLAATARARPAPVRLHSPSSSAPSPAFLRLPNKLAWLNCNGTPGPRDACQPDLVQRSMKKRIGVYVMSVLNLLISVRKAVADWRRCQRDYAELMDLDDHSLADIGIRRSQIRDL